MDSQKIPNCVTPAKAGVQNVLKALDSGVRRNDDKSKFQLFTSSSSLALHKAFSSMRSNKQLVIAICLSMMFSFLYGVIIGRYQVFPFDQLKAIKRLVIPSPRLRYSNYFYHKKSFFEQHGGDQYDVVFIGDSITDGAEWEDLFPSLKIANRGIGGDRTDCVLKRMDSIYSTNAKKAFTMIGINDFFAGLEVIDVLEKYKTILDNLVAHGMQVYVQSTILAGKRYAKLNKKIMDLNDHLKKTAAENKAITYIDLNASLAPELILDPQFSGDHFHLNGTGYAVWRDTIKSHLQ